MKFALLVSAGPYTHQAADSAWHFAKAAIAGGHEVKRVFFYHDGIYNATKLMDPPQDDRHIGNRWAALKQEHDVDLVVCVAAALRHQGRSARAGIPHLGPGPAGRRRHQMRPRRDVRGLTVKKFMFLNRKAP